jgi:multicomponent Na+:H+ antiporter subunit D
VSGAVPWLVALPLAGGAMTYLLPRRSSPVAGLVTALATLMIALMVALEVWLGGARRIALGGWGAPLGIELNADGVAASMILMTALATVMIGIFARGYFEEAKPFSSSNGASRAWVPATSFWPLLLFLWAAMNALYLSADIFNLYVGLELMTLAAVALVVLTDSPGVLGAGLRYLLAAFVGSLAFLLGIALLYASFDTLDLALLGGRLSHAPAAWLALALIAAGLALKTALFPLHFWLPRAHASAPAPVSALLSALVISVSFYVFLRIWTTVFPWVGNIWVEQFIGVSGAAAIVWGSLQAIRQQHLKLMIAYSTVAQVGYLFLMIPLMGLDMEAASLAWNGGIYHAISHAFAKAAMFMAAGCVIYSVGNDRIIGMSGIATHLPISTYAFGIAGLSLIGLPPTGGFVAKWLLLSSAIASGQWWWAVVILVGGVLTAGYVFLVLGQELSQSEGDERPSFKRVPRAMEYTAMILALVALLMGLRANELLELIQTGSPFAPGAWR